MADKHKKADQYNDPKFSYLKYWDDRQYENESEKIAIRRLLKGMHFNFAADVGGGYGRLSPELLKFADKVVLAEPSRQQLDLADDYLKDYPQISRKLMQADDLEFPDRSIDLLIMIRVMHHLPDPKKEFLEIQRVLSPDGRAIIEVANFMHARNRLKYLVQGKRMPVSPVDIRSKKNKVPTEIQFVNHNPKTITKQLAHAGLKVERILSVSNLRSPMLKRTVPKSLMLAAEDVLQPTLAKSYFGPSIFFLVRRASGSTA
jgi:ubiquinone/menaquinone biosynthesis C-methylase UbiE